MRLLAVVLLLIPYAAPAQFNRAYASKPREAPYWEKVMGVHVDSAGSWSVLGGVGYTFRFRPTDHFRDRTLGISTMVFAAVEPGQHNGRLSLGYATIADEGGMLASLRGTFLRQWRQDSRNWVGGELGVGLFFFTVRAGRFYALDDKGTTRWRNTADFGLLL